MTATERRIALEIVATDTECGKCQQNLATLPGADKTAGPFCGPFRRSILRGYRDELIRLPECIAAEKAQKGGGGE